MLNQDIVKNILSYTGNMRVLKIKMDKQNMKYLFETNSEIYDYLYKKTISSTSSLGEVLYLKIIFLLNNKNIKMNHLFQELLQEIPYEIYNKYKKCINENYVDFIINIIIDDYNNYYLVDEYYYDGYWLDEMWYSNKANDYLND
jgi:hypothetical protein